jgi:hypothetical protein
MFINISSKGNKYKKKQRRATGDGLENKWKKTATGDGRQGGKTGGKQRGVGNRHGPCE